MKKIIMYLSVCLLGGSVVLSSAQAGSFGGKGGHGEKSAQQKVEMLQKRLDLTPEQAEQIKSIMETGREEMKQLREQHRSKIEAVLTTEQAAEWKELHEKRMERMKHRGKKHRQECSESSES